MIDRSLPRFRNSIGALILFSLGAILAGAAELPYGGWIQILILSLVWWQIRKYQVASFKSTFLLGLSFGLGYFVLGLWWIYISLHDIGGMHAVVSGISVFYSQQEWLYSFLAPVLSFTCTSKHVS